MVAKKFQVGDLVWAKMKGYPEWPGEITEPPAKSKPKKAHHYVFFFGSDNHAWIPDERILLHNDTLLKELGNKRKTAVFQNAVKELVGKNNKETSKYVKHDNFESHSSSSSSEHASAQYKDGESHLEKYATSDTSSKGRISHSNSVPKKLKKLPEKKHTHLKKAPKKRSVSDYSAEGEDEGDNFENSSRKHFKLESIYENLLANIPPNINYNGDSIHSSVHSTGLLSRKHIGRPETPPIDLQMMSEALQKKEIHPTAKKIGFLGLGKLGQGIVKNLQQSGHSVVIWNRTPEKCTPFVNQMKVQTASTPADVVMASDITFCCVSDADAAKALVFGNCGIVKGLELCPGENKSYVEMTSMDPKSSHAIAEEIKIKGGRYLEAPLCGSRLEANEGTLFILAAGDQSLYDECKSCFDAASKKHMFISPEVGVASKLNLIHSMLIGTVYAAVAETLALVSRTGLQGEDFLEILKYGVLHSEVIINKGMSMVTNNYVSNTSLKHMQKNLNLGLMLGSSVEQPTPIIAAANEVYKHCKLLRYGDHDVSAVFEGTRP